MLAVSSDHESQRHSDIMASVMSKTLNATYRQLWKKISGHMLKSLERETSAEFAIPANDDELLLLAAVNNVTDQQIAAVEICHTAC